MEILKNIFKNIKIIIEKIAFQVIMWTTFIGVLTILYVKYNLDNYYYIHYYIFSSDLSTILFVYEISVFFIIKATLFYFKPLFIYDVMTSEDSLVQYYAYLFDHYNLLVGSSLATIRQYYEISIIITGNEWTTLASYYHYHLNFGPVFIISENFMEININAKIYLLICFVTVFVCTLYILYDSYKYYIDDKFIVKLRINYPILGDILMEGRNLIFDIEHFFLKYSFLCRMFVNVIYLLLIVYSNYDIDIGIYNNMEEYLYRSGLFEDIIIKHIKCILNDRLIL